MNNPLRRLQLAHAISAGSGILICPLLCFVLNLPAGTAAFAGWNEIIGIPEPDFGVNEQAPPVPDPWDDPVSGFYSVCPSCPDSTDTANEFGTPDFPRVRIPNPVPAGAVVEVHGQFDRDYISINSGGTAADPVFVRGSSTAAVPVFTESVTVVGSYIICENFLSAPFDADDTEFSFRIPEGGDHISIRNAEFSEVNNLHKAGGLGVGSWSYSGDEYAADIYSALTLVMSGYKPVVGTVPNGGG